AENDPWSSAFVRRSGSAPGDAAVGETRTSGMKARRARAGAARADQRRRREASSPAAPRQAAAPGAGTRKTALLKLTVYPSSPAAFGLAWMKNPPWAAKPVLSGPKNPFSAFATASRPLDI